jgi:uncharacterized sulfatase
METSSGFTRRNFVAAAAAAPLLIGAAKAPARPASVILVLADDLGLGDLGAYGARLIKTPEIDRLAKNGVRLTNFYASANVCTPSRAGLLTGRYPVRSGLAYKVVQPNDTHGLPPETVTIAEMLKPDYATALIGKWHLGHVAPFWPPTAHGFDLFFGLPYSHNMTPLSLYSSGPGVELTQEDVDFSGLTARFFDRGLQFIEENAARPFFLTLALTAPHAPLDPHADHAGRSKAGDYGDVVEEVDAQVGRLMVRLRALGIDRDTLVIITSDNGPWFEGSSGPARDRKGAAGWDGGYRVPLILHQPGRVPKGKTRDAIAMNFDLMPTIAAWTGAALPPLALDGKDLSGVILSGEPSPHEALLLFDEDKVAGIRTQRWKLVKESYYKSYKLDMAWFQITRQGALLFDLEQDPGETYSVASRHPEIFDALMSRLEQAKAEQW